jgi:hypothetical protein
MGLLARTGGMLLRPRRTVAALRDEEGEHDGRWLGALWVVAAHGWDLVELCARARALRGWDLALGVVGGIGMVVLAPVLALVACDAVLGPERQHRGGACLVAMVAVAALWNALALVGVDMPAMSLTIEAGVAASAAALAVWIRPAVPPRKEAA